MSVPSSELGPSPPPSQASVSPPLDPKGEGQHSLAGEGVGGPNSDEGTDSLVLCKLCASDPFQNISSKTLCGREERILEVSIYTGGHNETSSILA